MVRHWNRASAHRDATRPSGAGCMRSRVINALRREPVRRRAGDRHRHQVHQGRVPGADRDADPVRDHAGDQQALHAGRRRAGQRRHRPDAAGAQPRRRAGVEGAQADAARARVRPGDPAGHAHRADRQRRRRRDPRAAWPSGSGTTCRCRSPCSSRRTARSPGRSSSYVKQLRADRPRDIVSVFIPEYVVGHWWEQLLHNQSALRLKGRLLFQPGVMVTSVPWQLDSSAAAPSDRALSRPDGPGRGRRRHKVGAGARRPMADPWLPTGRAASSSSTSAPSRTAASASRGTRAGSCSSGTRCPASGCAPSSPRTAAARSAAPTRSRCSTPSPRSGRRRRARTPARAGAAAATGSTPAAAAQRALKAAVVREQFARLARPRRRLLDDGRGAARRPARLAHPRSRYAVDRGRRGRAAPAPLARGRARRSTARSACRGVGDARGARRGPGRGLHRRRGRRAATTARSPCSRAGPGRGRQARGPPPAGPAARSSTGPPRRAPPRGRTRLRGRRGRLLAGAPARAPTTFAGALLDAAATARRGDACSTSTPAPGALTAALAEAVGPTGRVVGVESDRAGGRRRGAATSPTCRGREVRRGRVDAAHRSPRSTSRRTSSCSTRRAPAPARR